MSKSFVSREVMNKFDSLVSVYPAIALVGARQAGKTTLLKEYSKTKNAGYLLFNDLDIRRLFEEDVKKFEKQYLEGYDYSILDEVHYCKNAGNNIKYLVDSGKKLWITSSSELILSREVLSYLVGRVTIIKLYPFSLKEFFNAKNFKEGVKQATERNVWEHLTYGGYPRVVLSEGMELKKNILSDLYQTMILKDVTNNFSIRDSESLELLTKYLSINIGNLLVYETITKNLGIRAKTIKKYLSALEKSYFIMKVRPYCNNKNKEIIKQPKIYFVDTGMRNLVAKSFNDTPEGKTFENYIAAELVKGGHELKYWRTKSGAEVDFVIEKDKELLPIEVKVTNPNNVGKGLRSFIETYKPRKAVIVHYEGEEKIVSVGNCKVYHTDILGLKKLLSDNSKKDSLGL
ncbi:AAA family ATPase [Candidatus Pacearchaeota archaeon CG10_big_fil_rev_8_21_14_0_10_35_13]|nr:MAG: AAA family ATPase [Candidatus Pacearchaeota archaeon CG10_big_fil_rev_8_21_14_0_10_35_13]